MKYKYTLKEIKAICALHGWAIYVWNWEYRVRSAEYDDGPVVPTLHTHIDVVDMPDGMPPYYAMDTAVYDSRCLPVREALRALHAWADKGFPDERR